MNERRLSSSLLHLLTAPPSLVYPIHYKRGYSFNIFSLRDLWFSQHLEYQCPLMSTSVLTVHLALSTVMLNLGNAGIPGTKKAMPLAHSSAKFSQHACALSSTVLVSYASVTMLASVSTLTILRLHRVYCNNPPGAHSVEHVFSLLDH